ncbi:anhydro-N-acetylmuramic acid kinase, partial [Kipferlia bialata]
AICRIEGEYPSYSTTLLHHYSMPLPPDLVTRLRSLAEGTPTAPVEFLRAARGLGQVYADMTKEGQTWMEGREGGEEGEREAIHFVVAHGQTIHHEPKENLSFQLFDPWPVVRQCSVPVLYDLRQADLIAGGEGAPISPIADPILYGCDSTKGTVSIINLGGICNQTHFVTRPGEALEVSGQDVCPCNILLNGLCECLLDLPYDNNGDAARAGSVDQTVCDMLTAYVTSNTAGAVSLGRELYHKSSIRKLTDACLALPSSPSPSDILRSGVEVVAGMVAGELSRVGTVHGIVAGGGVRHTLLFDRIGALCPGLTLQRSDDTQVPSEAREAACFAVLGAISDDGHPITIPRITKATQPGVAGAWVGLEHKRW